MVHFYYAVMSSGIPKAHVVFSINKVCFTNYCNFSYNNYFFGDI